MKRNPTRAVRVGQVTLGGGHPVAVQSMCATRTQDVDATVEQAEAIHAAGAGVVRVAVDNPEPVYVGRLGLTDDAGRQLLIDWRAPAAEPFFAATRANPFARSCAPTRCA